MQHFNIAIDGPAGAGKSTIARAAAARLGFIYVDTGAMYRAMALYVLRNNIQASGEGEIAAACQKADITIRYEEGRQQVWLNGEDVSTQIRAEEVGNLTSQISVYLPVREKLLELQRQLAESNDVIMDGRDIGTCVLPGAQVKIYLTASSSVRAERRFRELSEKGFSCDLAAIEKDIIDRDYRDMHREYAPLKQAEDAVYLDTSYLSMEEVISRVIDIAKERGLKLEG